MLIRYLQWHFWDVPKGLVQAWKNFLWFNLKYFSVALLLKTLFAPWHGYKESYGRGFDIKRYFESFMFNMISRAIGAIVRIVFIVIAICLEVLIFFAGMIIFIIWFVLPILLLAGLYSGFKILF